MKYTISYAAALVAAFSALGHAANDIPKCGNGSQCPDYAPCCSQYGQCGVGAYCLGGCDPRNSFNLQSCLAAPACKSNDFSMNSLDAPAVRTNTRYLGNGSETNWVTSGEPRQYQDSVLLTMAPSTVGTLLMSAHYVWYGKIKATMKTSQGAGVVTAFILMSDMKDEIDFEFVGNEMSTVQTNYYFQGITDCKFTLMILLGRGEIMTNNNHQTATATISRTSLTLVKIGTHMRLTGSLITSTGRSTTRSCAP